MGPAVYDSRIRPAGINGTGEQGEIMLNRNRDFNRKWRSHITVYKVWVLLNGRVIYGS